MRRRSKNKYLGYAYFILKVQGLLGDDCLACRKVNLKKILHRKDIRFRNGIYDIAIDFYIGCKISEGLRDE